MHSFTISSIMLALATLGNTAALTKRVQAANGNNDLTSVGKYYGCYTDNVGSRQLARATYADYKQMTQNACIKFCKDNGFPFAGLEFASECWCDYSLGSIATKKDDSECSYTCTGNKNQVCGGYDRLSVFQTTVTSTAPSVNPGPTGWTSLGCYNDNIPGRVLAYRYGVVGGDGAMSVQLCANACKAAGFAYAGVEYSSECYCDNNILSGAQSGQSGCNMLCSGNSTEYCGGSNRISVYQSTAKGKTAGEIPSGWTAQGCLKDNVLGRALTVAMAITGGPASMTAEGCVDACSSAGYKIAGVEYSQECWCGNTIQNGGVPTLPSDGCNMPCRGNTLETCGGSNRLNVYANYPLNLVIPSSSTSSSVSTTSATTLSSTTRSSSSSSSAISTTSSSTQTTLSSSSTSSSSTRSTTSSSVSSSSSSSTSTSSSTSSSSSSISTSSSSTVAATSTSASPACASPSPTSEFPRCTPYATKLTLDKLPVVLISKIPDGTTTPMAG
ncbi:copper radical oxidase [Colletotrichum truncatum]|uniref:Copper radical oxidase n=1 Tax=Colletotrichum truncatum TaxID=5467 RepID=A0ACC3Z1Z1_COLTU